MMFSKSQSALLTLSVLAVSDQAFGRIRWLERDDKAVFLHPRRFGQEHPAVIDQLSAACPGQVCGVLSGQAITPLLAAQGECTQQDMADSIIDAAQQFDNVTKASMIALAVEYRQVEKNTPPDFTTNPPTNRNSVFCQTAPKNSQLNGLVQAQDPANDPNVFFDPATQASVQKGAQPNTFPFGTSGSSSSNSSALASVSVSASTSVSSSVVSVTATGDALVVASTTATDDCEATVTVTAAIAAATTSDSSVVTVSVGDTATTIASSAVASSTASSSSIGNFGTCSVPQIEFATGFDGRKETSFQPVDQTSYNHGSAQNIDVITQFICDSLVNTCGADQTAKNTCATAKAAADTVTAETGGQADAFNAVFGIQTDFAAVAVVDDTGKTISPGTGSSSTVAVSASAATLAGTTTASAVATTATASTSSGIGDFGKCSVPQIEFGTGFDGRKETSFEPVDQTSYNHGSAQNIDIITQFICNTLVNSCGADQTAQNTCATATAAADAVAAETGGQADAFNAVFGIKTDFAAVASVDDQGNVIAGTGSSASPSEAASPSAAAVTTSVAATTTSAVAAASTTAAAAASTGNLQTFTGALGGVTAPVVTALGNGQFQVEGNSAFNNVNDALSRSCDVQNNQCADNANATGNQGDITVAACGTQLQQCDAAH
ncbi:hypothetical protein A0H81_07966 [Grifola frondosa]|uniref:Uncharacterized protein n=1 Tax=Grifola frondosa TaxID=5627 RepID=A0A1C7M749_GRIFR|nr:hypothetical protein A0H81_07966 [Grifola frondosa]